MKFNWWFEEKHDQLYNYAAATRGCLNIKLSSYQYRDPHVKDHNRLIFNMGISVPGIDTKSVLKPCHKGKLFIDKRLHSFDATVVTSQC